MIFESTYHWEKPIHTGVIFGSVLATLISICYFSLISVAAYASLALLLVNFLTVLAHISTPYFFKFNDMLIFFKISLAKGGGVDLFSLTIGGEMPTETSDSQMAISQNVNRCIDVWQVSVALHSRMATCYYTAFYWV